jgi:hypothetical protein
MKERDEVVLRYLLYDQYIPIFAFTSGVAKMEWPSQANASKNDT